MQYSNCGLISDLYNLSIVSLSLVTIVLLIMPKVELALYILFTADISRLFAKYSASGHFYADDVQAYVHGPPSQFLDTSSIASLAADLDSWMSSNRLSLNPSKTQLIWLGTRQQLPKLDFALLAAQFP